MGELTSRAPADTLDAALRQRAAADGTARAFLQKRHGVWHASTWAEVDATVTRLAAGLLGAGLAPGDAVGIVSGSRIEAVFAVLACQRAHRLPVLLNPLMPAPALARRVEAVGIRALVLEDQEQVDKIADTQSRLPLLRWLWVIDPKGTRAYTHIRARPWETLLEGQAGVPTARPAEARPAMPAAVVLFTAGVHDEPRPVCVGHDALSQLHSACEALGIVAGERLVSQFGLADPIGFFFAVVAPVLSGSVTCFGEERLPTVADMRQCAPRIVAMPARLVDRLRRETVSRTLRAGPLRRRLVERWNDGVGLRALLHGLVGQPLANGLGLGACRRVLTGYEPMASSSAQFLARLRIDALGLYGLTEAGGPVGLFARAEHPMLQLFAPYRWVIKPGQQLCVTVAGRELPTGDLATQSEGILRLVGRAAELLTLPGGARVAPAAIETALLSNPYINQAVAVGGPAGGVAALVELDEVTLRDWARSHCLAFTTLRSFAESSEVRRLIDQAVDAANQQLEPAARIRRVVLLPRPLDAANGELTPALALRRATIRNRYAHRLVEGGSP